MRLPWVSRARLEDAERRLEQSEAERRDLLERLIGEVKETKLQPESAARPYSTPFDSIGARWEKAHPRGVTPPPRFKARM